MGEILEMPGAEEILAKHRVPCLTCPMAKMEIGQLKLGDVCRAYGIDVETLLKDLNKAGKNQKS